MRLDKLIYDVREAINAYSDELNIDDRYIIYLYGIKRSKYLRQDLNNLNKVVDASIQQSLCLEMELVSAESCGIDIGCDKILRSKQRLPGLLGLHTKSSIVSVRPTNKIKAPFSFVTKERVDNLDGAPYQGSVYSFLDTDGHLYIYSNNESYKMIDCLTVTAVFEDPLQLSNYKNCCNCEKPKACFDEMTSDYPLQPHYIDIIRGEIVVELLNKLKLPQDRVNDEKIAEQQRIQQQQEAQRQRQQNQG